MAKNKKNKKGTASSSKSSKPSKPSATKAAVAPAKTPSKSNNDVAEETFPAEAPAPIVNVAEPATPAETTREVEVPAVNESPAAANRFAGEQAPKENETAPTSKFPEHLKNVGPRTPHSDEKKLEKFVLANNITRTISEEQLSKSGINMTKINLLNGRIGKFKLKRNFRKEKFLISIVE